MQACPISHGGIGFEMVDLVSQAQRGDATAFEALYRQHVGRVYALCRRLTGDADRAEEMTQETFIRAWRHRGVWRQGDAFAGWLCRVAINVTLSENRAHGRRARRETAVDDLASRVPAAPGPGPGTALDLERAIARLPEGARRVFVLHDVEGFLHGEIADLLGLSTGTSKAQLHRARRLLKEALTP